MKEFAAFVVGMALLAAGALTTHSLETCSPKNRSEIKESVPEVTEPKKVELGSQQLHLDW